MRVAALSDIHGNLPALEAVLTEVERERVDGIVVAGDTISGPWPVEVLELLESIGASLVHGNADREVVLRSDRYGPLQPWCADLLGGERLARVASWPTTLELDVEGLGRILVCHSTPSSDEPIYTQITPDAVLSEVLGPVEADVLVCGHTHVQYDRRLATGLRVVNPGSVGMPYEGRAGGYWALLGPDVELRRTGYDVGSAKRAIEARGAPIDASLLEQLVNPPDPEVTIELFESHRGT